MKEFNLEEFKKNPSQKVVTRDGREVRIICTDYKSTQPIIALITTNTKEDVRCFYKNGRWSNTNVSNLDLFFATTKREGWINVYSEQEYRHPGENIFATKEDAIKYKDINYIATIKIEWEE